MGGRRSCLVTLFLLCSLFTLLPFTADDYADCTDPFPDELLDILGLIERPVNGIPTPHVSLNKGCFADAGEDKGALFLGLGNRQCRIFINESMSIRDGRFYRICL